MAQVRPLQILVKGLIIFLIANIVYALIDPSLKLTVYNLVFPGRVRMPFNSNSYSVMVDDLDVMLASHRIARPKPAGEFRVVLIGDSSIWGEDLPVADSISEIWNEAGYQCGGKSMVFYNLGYPHPSVIKDLVILQRTKKYRPDAAIWFTTANSLMPRRINPFIAANRDLVVRLLDAHNLSMRDEEALRSDSESFYDKTIVGKRSLLARWMKLQMLGIIWSATAADVDPSADEDLSPPANDLKKSLRYLGYEPDPNLSDLLALNAIDAGVQIAGSTPLLIVNEPIFIATGQNSDIRYSDGYPRWAYDQYRAAMAERSLTNRWNYVDMWNAMPAQYFINELHMSSDGERLFTEILTPILKEKVCD